ncbi:MAG: HEAT repeat domain-containing protein [Planctomycetota bacterium]
MFMNLRRDAVSWLPSPAFAGECLLIAAAGVLISMLVVWGWGTILVRDSLPHLEARARVIEGLGFAAFPASAEVAALPAGEVWKAGVFLGFFLGGAAGVILAFSFLLHTMWSLRGLWLVLGGVVPVVAGWSLLGPRWGLHLAAGILVPMAAFLAMAGVRRFLLPAPPDPSEKRGMTVLLALAVVVTLAAGGIRMARGGGGATDGFVWIRDRVFLRYVPTRGLPDYYYRHTFYAVQPIQAPSDAPQKTVLLAGEEGIRRAKAESLLLARRDIFVDKAGTCAEAAEKWSRGGYDAMVIVSDMPDKDKGKVWPELLANTDKGIRETCFIVVGGAEFDPDRNPGKEGMERFSRLLNECLEKKQGWERLNFLVGVAAFTVLPLGSLAALVLVAGTVVAGLLKGGRVFQIASLAALAAAAGLALDLAGGFRRADMAWVERTATEADVASFLSASSSTVRYHAAAVLSHRLEKRRQQEKKPVVIPAVTAALIRATADEDVRVRYWALAALGDSGDPAALAVLADRLRNDSSLLVRYEAARAFGSLGQAAAAAYLHEVVRGRDGWYVRNEANNSLRLMGMSRTPLAPAGGGTAP